MIKQLHELRELRIFDCRKMQYICGNWHLVLQNFEKQLMSDYVAMVTQLSMILHVPKQCLNNFLYFLDVHTFILPVFYSLRYLIKDAYSRRPTGRTSV